MNFLKKNKVTIGGIIVVVLGVYAYFTYFGGDSVLLSSTPVDDTSIGGDLLVTLNSLHTITLDESIFKDPVFVSLSDFGVTIPPQQSGRRNPFAPVGQGGAPAAPTQ